MLPKPGTVGGAKISICASVMFLVFSVSSAINSVTEISRSLQSFKLIIPIPYEAPAISVTILYPARVVTLSTPLIPCAILVTSSKAFSVRSTVAPCGVVTLT
ncbi:hypothetical protein D3C72_1396670 [compost metagenome]